MIKIYNNRTIYNLYSDNWQILLPLELVLCLKDANKYPDLVEAILEHGNPSSKMAIDWSALANAPSILLAAFNGFTELVEKLSKKYEDPVVETSRG